MNLEIKFKDNYSADGEYTIYADGCDMAALYWADGNGALPEWTAFGYVKIDAGLGRLDYYGGRGVPFEATHVFVKTYRKEVPDYKDSPDCKESPTYMEEPSTTEGLFPIKRDHRAECGQSFLQCGILTDLHLTRKAGTVKWALRAAADADCILLLGDMTNDGSREEFRLFENCLNETVPGVPVYCVNGNHDLMSASGENAYKHTFEERRMSIMNEVHDIMTDADEYEDFQKRIAHWESETQNICHASINGIDMIGINAGVLWTRDTMRITPEQLESIDSLLEQGDGWKIVLCHTPLSRDMPVRNGHLSKYLSRDKQLQEIVDKHEQVIFLSGHTHLSPNLDSGVVSFDSARNNLYVNCGSIRPTELGKEAALALPEWKEGNVVELRIMEKVLEVRMRTIHTRKWISRGYYFIGM